MMNNKWTFRKDDDGHWFLLPEPLVDKFEEMFQQAVESDDYGDFSDMFDKYQTDGPHSLVFNLEGRDTDLGEKECN